MAGLKTAVLLGLLLISFGFKSAHGQDHKPVCESNDDAYKIITFLDFVQDIVRDAKGTEGKCSEMKHIEKPMDCADLKKAGKPSGVYKVWPRNRVVRGSIDVMCDMDDDRGGWTVVQRRGDFHSPKDYFYRDWNSYKVGFGNLLQDFWLGNDAIFALTNQRACSIKFVFSDWDGNWVYATYDDFWIDDELHNYTVHVNGYRGTAGDSFSGHNEKPFATKDRHNNINPTNCAVEFKGAWWYDKCHVSNLNGLYLKGSHDSFADGVNWKAYKDYKYSLKDTFMRIRPKEMN